MNGVIPEDGWGGLFKRGEKIRLRFISAVAMTNFDVHIPGLKMTVVSSDGQNIDPVTPVAQGGKDLHKLWLKIEVERAGGAPKRLNYRLYIAGR